mmetsp:Transcript_27117/g.40778  ORF Transcript_27117/g.40778 Transcript_27117/m.40778 type:complete len:202 (-) Transcript_27117:938-1543(-)
METTHGNYNGQFSTHPYLPKLYDPPLVSIATRLSANLWICMYQYSLSFLSSKDPVSSLCLHRRTLYHDKLVFVSNYKHRIWYDTQHIFSTLLDHWSPSFAGPGRNWLKLEKLNSFGTPIYFLHLPCTNRSPAPKVKVLTMYEISYASMMNRRTRFLLTELGQKPKSNQSKFSSKSFKQDPRRNTSRTNKTVVDEEEVAHKM